MEVRLWGQSPQCAQSAQDADSQPGWPHGYSLRQLQLRASPEALASSRSSLLPDSQCLLLGGWAVRNNAAAVQSTFLKVKEQHPPRGCAGGKAESRLPSPEQMRASERQTLQACEASSAPTTIESQKTRCLWGSRAFNQNRSSCCGPQLPSFRLH